MSRQDHLSVLGPVIHGWNSADVVHEGLSWYMRIFNELGYGLRPRQIRADGQTHSDDSLVTDFIKDNPTSVSFIAHSHDHYWAIRRSADGELIVYDSLHSLTTSLTPPKAQTVIQIYALVPLAQLFSVGDEDGGSIPDTTPPSTPAEKKRTHPSPSSATKSPDKKREKKLPKAKPEEPRRGKRSLDLGQAPAAGTDGGQPFVRTGSLSWSSQFSGPRFPKRLSKKKDPPK